MLYQLQLMKKATESQFNELHNLVTKEFLSRIKSGEASTQDLKAACDWLKANDMEFLSRIKSGEASTQDLKAACDWLKANDISGVQFEGNALDKLANVIPQIDPELVQRRLYGSKQRV